MKRSLAVALTLGLIASLASAAEVESVNKVGYNTLQLTNGLNLVRLDFVDMSGAGYTSSTVFGDALPLGSQVITWTGTTYSFDTYDEQTGPPPGFVKTTNWTVDVALTTGEEGFWVSVPGTAPAGIYPVTGSGEVFEGATYSIALQSGLNLVGYPYPVETLWVDTAQAAAAEVNDQVIVWTGSTYTFNTYAEQTGPPPGFIVTTNWVDTAMTIDIGQGFWYNSGSGATWVEPKPF